MPIKISLCLLALIHLMPLTGVLGNSHLQRLYDLPLDEPNLSLLMRHRAVLFGLLGTFLLYAVFQPQLQGLALIAAWISVLSFLLLGYGQSGLNPALIRVMRVDMVAVILLLIASIDFLRLRMSIN